MSDLKSTLDRALEDFEPSSTALAGTVRRGERRRQQRRIGTAVVAVAVAAAAFGASALVYRNAERTTPGQQPPAQTVEVFTGAEIAAPTIVSLDQTLVARVPEAPAGATDFNLSSNGGRLAFVSSDGRVGIMNVDGSDVRYLTDPGTLARDPEWSFRGDRIVFWEDRPGGGVFMVRPNPGGEGTGSVTELNAWGYEPSWLGSHDWGVVFRQKLSISALFVESLRQGASHVPVSLAPRGECACYDLFGTKGTFSDVADGHNIVGLYSWAGGDNVLWLVRASCACPGSRQAEFFGPVTDTNSRRPSRDFDRVTPIKIALSPTMTELAISERCEGDHAGTGIMVLDLDSQTSMEMTPRWLIECTPGVNIGLGSFTPDGEGLLLYREP